MTVTTESAIFVSQDSKVVDPLRAGLTPSSIAAIGASATDLLGIRDPKTAKQLHLAVIRAVRERRVSSVHWRAAPHQLGNLVNVRPAQEPGLAVISMTNLDAPQALEPLMLADIFGLTRVEAEIAVAIYGGLDLTEIARRRVVRIESVRAHVKALLRKIGVADLKQLTLVLSRVDFVMTPEGTERGQRRFTAIPLMRATNPHDHKPTSGAVKRRQTPTRA